MHTELLNGSSALSFDFDAQLAPRLVRYLRTALRRELPGVVGLVVRRVRGRIHVQTASHARYVDDALDRAIDAWWAEAVAPALPDPVDTWTDEPVARSA